MGIIDFILDNWFVVFIALAFFSSLFKRRNQPSAGQEKNAGGGMPTFGGRPYPGEETASFPGLYPDPNSEKAEDDPVRMVSGGFPFSSVPEPEEREDIKRAEGRAEGITVEANPNKRNGAGRNPQRSSPAVLSRSRLAEAVVWSEILGPPRAKKPFRHGSNRLQ